MAGRTVGAHLDERSADRLGRIAESEGRNPSQLVAVATRFLVDMSPAARRALISLDGSKPEEREFVTRLLGRAALKAREKVVASRVNPKYSPVTNSPLDTEDAIDAEAVMAARR
ncbi:hypothetical protein [Aliihoeflea sp. 40Bstr573]|uniref:hypothetical protein n=1 Tax=Aliihoeflea sp. 40Bstr573 TaxID=2696467 RepID=UPI0020956FCF|nr:hypothetical protein [Aliihoeflea sp. 40Bstr573]MCO6389246.1 hypothetical protein [Aliihoeflea sp. 40Bstr573]